MYAGEPLNRAFTSGEELASLNRRSIMDSEGRPKSAESVGRVSIRNTNKYAALTLMTCASRRQYFAVEMRERVCERVSTFVRAHCYGGIDGDAVIHQELLQKLSRCDQEVAIAPLTSELE